MWVAEKGREPSLAELVDPATTAVIVIDVQNDFLHPDGAFGKSGRDNSANLAFAARLRAFLDAARAHQLLTLFVRATYDEDVTSSALAHNRLRRGLVEGLCYEGSWGADWYEGVRPAGLPQEVVLTKHRFDAFVGTDLDLQLRTHGIKSVIVTGTATSGCVESTVRHAFFEDYYVVVAEDGVTESEPDNHANALQAMARSFARLVPLQEIVRHWQVRNTPLPPPCWSAAAKAARAAAVGSAQALLLVDPQESRRGQLAPVLGRIQAVLAEARRQGLRIAHLHGARGAPDPALPELAPLPGEWLVAKPRSSGFADSRLQLLLRTSQIRAIAVAGAGGLGDLDATVRDALDRDFTVFLPDGTTGFEPEDRDLMAAWRRALARAGARFTGPP